MFDFDKLYFTSKWVTKRLKTLKQILTSKIVHSKSKPILLLSLPFISISLSLTLSFFLSLLLFIFLCHCIYHSLCLLFFFSLLTHFFLFLFLLFLSLCCSIYFLSSLREMLCKTTSRNLTIVDLWWRHTCSQQWRPHRENDIINWHPIPYFLIKIFEWSFP